VLVPVEEDQVFQEEVSKVEYQILPYQVGV
jgi:hypothetical protein